ncbi:MAG: hypothetical protein RL380_837 [Verrucomicrobiota bacterium]
MAERWVINASPVILLAKAEVIQFVPLLCDELVIPAGVVAEVQSGRVADAGKIWLANLGQKFIRPVPAVHPALVEWRGGHGEAEVISFALQNPGFTAVLDDSRARKLAARHGVALLGSLRVIVLAKERGFIALAKPALEKLRDGGGYVSHELIDRAIQFAGEQ